MQRGMQLLLLGFSLLAYASAQGASTEYEKDEGGPLITLRKCSAPGSCKKEIKRLTLDANWRWVHKKGTYKNCYEGNEWDTEYCPENDGKTCAQTCDLESINAAGYKTTYGVEAFEDGVSMKFVNKHKYGVSVGARLYMYNGCESGAGCAVLGEKAKYEMFIMHNAEFAFDADMKELECGMNGAVYFVEMTDNGGMGIGDNKAGAQFGTGYCDAQCPHDMKFIDGEANINGWKPNAKDKSGNMGTGEYGACCNEMDIWEANSMSQAYTPHPCSFDGGKRGVEGVHRCKGTECGDNDKGERYKGVCDKDGCDFASWRMGARKFYGRGSEFDIDTSKKFTQVTQFVTSDNTDNGDLVEIRRIWKQNGKLIENTDSPHLAKGKCLGAGNSLTDDLCKSQNELFGDFNHFQAHGGNKVMGESLKRGHVLAISLWDDVDVSMMWLDSWFPRNKDKDQPGVSRGPCTGGAESTPTAVRAKFADAKVYYTNFAVGCNGCTTPGIDAGKKPYSPAPPAPKCSHGDDEPSTRRRSKPTPVPEEGRRRTTPKTRRRTTNRRRTRRRRSTPKTRRRSSRRRSTRRRSR